MASSQSDSSAPNYEDGLDWIAAYLAVRSMSTTSYRVTYALWIIMAAFFLIGALLHLVGTHRPYYFAHWSKWALRRRTWRKHWSKKERETSPATSALTLELSTPLPRIHLYPRDDPLILRSRLYHPSYSNLLGRQRWSSCPNRHSGAGGEPRRD